MKVQSYSIRINHVHFVHVQIMRKQVLVHFLKGWLFLKPSNFGNQVVDVLVQKEK
jgi:hypothetical protein